jgi:hypothetical protein
MLLMQHSIFKFIRINRFALKVTTVLLDISYPNTDLEINIPGPLFQVTACHHSDILISMLLLSEGRPGKAWKSCEKVTPHTPPPLPPTPPHHHPHHHGRPDHDQQHCYHHAPTVKQVAATAVFELMMMGVRTLETC